MTDSGAGHPILVVDESGSFVARVGDALEDALAGAEIHTASGVSEARADAPSGLDCVLTTDRLADGSPIDLIEAVRGADAYPPVVLLGADAAVAADVLSRPATEYLPREVVAEGSVLAERVRRQIEEGNGGAGSRPSRHLDLVADVATDAFFTVDLATGAFAMSDGVEQFGYDPEAVGDDHDWWLERVHPDDRERMRRAHEMATTPDPKGFEEYSGDRGFFRASFRWRRADGTYADVDARGVTLFESGEATEQVGTMRDVSERRERGEHLELFRRLIDESNALIFINDAHTGELVYANETAAAELGYDRETLREMNVHEIETTLSGESEMVDHFADVREQGSLHYEGRQRRKDGSTFPVEVDLSYVSLEEDYVVAVARNVAEQRARERELEQTNARLERFASVLSHDLQNPLSIAKGHLALAREGNEASFDAIETALDRMERIVDDVLYVERDGNDVAPSETVDVPAVARESWAIVSGTDAATLDVDWEDGPIRADRSRLAQLLENLFDNAIEHGGSDVTVRVESIPGGFAVADDGAGIPPEDREAVFEEGYTTSEGGTGLGMTIVSDIVAGHDWEIAIAESEAGGARFEITGVERVEDEDR